MALRPGQRTIFGGIGRQLVQAHADHLRRAWLQQDRGTLYSADGQAIGIVSVFTLTHITWRDSNRNGVPDPGEVTADVSQFRVTCP